MNHIQVGAGHCVRPKVGGRGPGGPGDGGALVLGDRPEHQATLLAGLLLLAPGRHLLRALPGGRRAHRLGRPHSGAAPGRLPPVQAQVTCNTGRLIHFHVNISLQPVSRA